MFKDLEGHYKRGILLEANIRYLGHQNSKYCKVGDKEKFFEQECEKLSRDYKKYDIISSKVLYLYPLKKDRDEYIKQRAIDYSKILDTSYIIKLGKQKSYV